MFYCPDEDTIIFHLSSGSVELYQFGSPETQLELFPSDLLSLDMSQDFVSVSEGRVLELIRSENVFANYKTQDVDEVSNVTYVGKLAPNGKYLIEKITDNSGDLVILYANLSNNPTQFTYSNAWGNRITLTYNLISSLTGL